MGYGFGINALRSHGALSLDSERRALMLDLLIVRTVRETQRQLYFYHRMSLLLVLQRTVSPVQHDVQKLRLNTCSE